MRDEAFCLIGLLRGRSRLSEILPLLPPARRAAIQDHLNRLSQLPENDLRSRWKQMREQEMDALCKRAAQETGIRADLMPPFLQGWICDRARNS